MSRKSPIMAAKSRQYVMISNPLVSGRKLSATSSKRRDFIELSPTKSKRISNSPTSRSKPPEGKINDVGVLEANATGKNFVERITSSINSKIECKSSKLTDRDKEILNRVMSRSVNGKKKFSVDKSGGMNSSVDLSAAARAARRLSQVLRSEHQIMHKNQQYAIEVQQLRQQMFVKESEVQRAQSVGIFLRQVFANQAAELKAYKEVFPTLLEELSYLRENHHKQENNLKLEIKQTRTFNTTLAERVCQYEKSQCTSCRLYINRISMNKEMSTVPCKTKPVLPSRTPTGLRSDSNVGRWTSPRAVVKPMKELEYAWQQEIKKPPAGGTEGVN